MASGDDTYVGCRLGRLVGDEVGFFVGVLEGVIVGRVGLETHQ
jgi:hypothetical protein